MKEFLGLPLLPENAAVHGAIIDDVILYTHWLMIPLFVGWSAYFIYVLFRFRQGANPKADYRGATGTFSKYLEAGVILAEIILLFGFSIPLWKSIANEFPPEKDSLVIRVVAEQFAWNIHYPGADGKFGKTTPGLIDLQSNPLGLDRKGDPDAKDDVVTKLLRLPVNKPVIAHLTSKDVIHSFGIPAFRVKQDAIPGSRIPVTFTPIKEGKYLIACSQLCGVGHSTMRGFIQVEPLESFDQWYLAESAGNAKGAAGANDSW